MKIGEAIRRAVEVSAAAVKRAAAIGVGAVKLREVRAPVRAGDELHAVVELEGGERGDQLDGLVLRLEEERLDFEHVKWGDFNFWRESATAVLPLHGRSIAPRERISVPIVLKIPADLEPSAPHRRYRVRARVKARTRYPSDSAVVDVLGAAD